MGIFTRQAVEAKLVRARAVAGSEPAEQVSAERRATEICFQDPTGKWITLKGYADERDLSYSGALWRYKEWGTGDPRFWDMRKSPKDVKLGGATRADVRVISWRGVTRTVREWAEYLGITVQAMWQRLKKWGICERTFTPPRRRKGNLATGTG